MNSVKVSQPIYYNTSYIQPDDIDSFGTRNSYISVVDSHRSTSTQPIEDGNNSHIKRRNQYNIGNRTIMNRIDLLGVKTLMKVIVLLQVLSLVITIGGLGWLQNLYTHQILTKLDMENEVIFDNMRRLYQNCKENPLDFDWAAEISTRIEDSSKTIINAISEKISQQHKVLQGKCYSINHNRSRDSTQQNSIESIRLIVQNSDQVIFKLNDLSSEDTINQDTDFDYAHTDLTRRRFKPTKHPWFRPGGPPGIKST